MSLRSRLLHALYDGLFLAFLIVALPYFMLRALRDRRIRDSLGGRLGRGPARAGTRRCVWVHGVSVGEVKAARLFIEELAARRPDLDVVLSSTTPAGFQLAREQHPDRLVIQFPLDLRFVMRRVFDRLRPDLIVLVELEIWPNLLAEAAARGVPVAVVNGRISARSFRGYRVLGRLLPQFDLIELYAVQNEEYAQRLRVLDVPERKIRVTGNMKYDTLKLECEPVGSSRVDLQACKLEYSIVSPK